MGQHKRDKHLQACRYCEAKFSKERSRCPSCRKWNTPEPFDPNQDGTFIASDIEETTTERIVLGFPWDICFGPGIPPGVVIPQPQGMALTQSTLLAGSPGAGKSTMSLQIGDRFTQKTGRETFYILSEEEMGDVVARAKRLGYRNLSLLRFYPQGANKDIGDIITARKNSIGLVIVDSISGLVSSENAPQFAKRLKQLCSPLRIPVLILDHITKDGDIAGFKDLEHEVDTTMLLMSEEDEEIRELFVRKNRFGVANFRKTLQMTVKGVVDYEYDDEESEEDS